MSDHPDAEPRRPGLRLRHELLQRGRDHEPLFPDDGPDSLSRRHGLRRTDSVLHLLLLIFKSRNIRNRKTDYFLEYLIAS